MVMVTETVAQVPAIISTKDKKAIKYFQQATELLRKRDFVKAVSFMEKAVVRDSAFWQAHQQLGIAYKIMGDKEQTIEHYAAYLKYQPKDYKIALLVANLLLDDGYYERAEPFYRMPLKITELPGQYRNNAERGLATCQFAQKELANPSSKVTPEPLPGIINQYAFQYFPSLTADEKTIFYTIRKQADNHSDEQIYKSKCVNGNWEAGTPLPDNINTEFNEGTASISADGRTMVFTVCANRKDLRGSCDLYISYKEGDAWSEPENLGDSVNTTFWESQPSLSADGRTVYFTSRRTDGFGNADIWMTTQHPDGHWQRCRNLGDMINTPEDDIAPFIHTNGSTLYFASRGHTGMGGLDMFKSERQGKTKWSWPNNLGYPINTYEGETGLTITADGKKAYYSRSTLDRGRSVGSELYFFDLPPSAQPTLKAYFVEGSIYQEDNTEQKLKAQVALVDVETNETIYKMVSDSSTGEYLVVLPEGGQYALHVTKKGYLFNSKSFDLTEEAQSLELNVPLKPIKKGSVTTLNNIFFDYNDYSLKPKSESDLELVIQFIKQHPQLKFEISGHTDSKGTDENNMVLSRQRAKAVYNFLINKGVDAGRITYKGYGETRPQKSNETEEGRQANRRIDFTIL